ncbi:hypothetical protein Q1W73_00705 [Asticcacaulis sp. ZE23SCel15]|uniref:hypothetical protein n=1 Tax=Asticcacaulis sp. ZE23SCel15 TaxID=3059027 RepID=UPI00265F515C|nr:hypothetical protein [Asticcacaulis sp. ZE23SCel15]WKL57539.1 hypothetical protein Q1W73_00705 [Asticcacaulis sp. ZE23SCel15]
MLKKIAGATEKTFTIINLITGLSVMGVTAWISNNMASQTKWIAQAGPYGIWIATLAGTLVVAIIAMVLVKAKGWYQDEKMRQKWRETPRSVNPLDTEFHKLRIDISSLANPFNKTIVGKKFTECELIGPAVFVFMGTGSATYGNFVSCDICVVRPGWIYNVIVFENCNFTHCKFYNCTIFISPDMIPAFKSMGAEFVTFTGDQGIDSQPRPSMQGNRPR